jgi:predicted nucleic-acid-binding protein
LKTVYDFDRRALTEVLREVVADKAFCFENISRLEAAISRHEMGRADFPDYLIDETAKSYHRRLETFDKKLIKG